MIFQTHFEHFGLLDYDTMQHHTAWDSSWSSEHHGHLWNNVVI